MLRINTLGGLAITRDGEPVTGLATRKVEALLVYLACTGGSHAREVLAERFWAERAAGRALGNLRVALTSLRKEVGDYLLISRDAVSMQPGASVWLDAAQLEEQLRAGQLEEAVALYRGEFLSGFYVRGCPGFEDWLTLERERLRRLALDALRDLVDHHLQAGDYRAGIAQAARLLELDPLLEEAHRQLMRLLAYDGQRGAALAQYETCRRVLQDELGVEPDEETARLYQQIHDGELEVPALPSVREPEAVATAPAFLAEAGEVAPRPVFVARERELARLDGFLQRALAGQGRVVFVTGGPGRGKTALLDAFARQAMDVHGDLLVASGTCNAYSGLGDPYLPFREAMDMLTGDVEARWAAGTITREHAQRLWDALPAAVEALLDHGPHVVGAMVRGGPLLARATGADTGSAPWLERLRERVEREQSHSQGLEQTHLFQQITNLLHALAAKHPLLLILDDLQWADTASIGLLFHLGRRLEGSPILVAGAYRPEEIALGREGERHPLEQVLAEFKRAFGDVWLDLAEVPQPEGRRFVDAFLQTEPNRLGEDFRQALFEHTSGHPLFTVELLRTMQERGDLVQDSSGCWVEGSALDWDTLPARVEGVIEARIGRLNEELREFLSVASVEGEAFTGQVVARVLEVDERQALRWLSRELGGRHRLVREQSALFVDRQRLSRYRFAHALFQQYLYNDLGDAERMLLHGEIAGVLEELYHGHLEEVAVSLARHYSKAGDEGRALRYFTLAGDMALASYAHQEAEAHYRRALELAPAEAERAHLLAGLGEALFRLGQLDEALQALREGIGLYQALGNPDGVAGLYSRLARVAWWTGDHAGALRLCEEGLEAVAGASESREQAQLLHEAARAVHFAFLPEKARLLCQRALEMAERLGAVDVEIDALATLGMLCDTPQEGLKALERAAKLAEEGGFLDLAGRAHNNLAALWSNLQGDSRTARQHTMRSVALAQQTGDIPKELFARSNAIGDAAMMGDLEEAAAHLLRMRHLAAELADPGEASWMILDGEATIQWYRGDWVYAARFARERLPEAHRLGDLQNEAGFGHQLADALLEAHFAARESDIHELLEAERALTRVLEIMEAWSNSLRFAQCHCLLSALFASQGRLEEAHSHLEEARRCARYCPQTGFEAAVLWAEGRLALAEARWSEAGAAFELMVGLREQLGLRWHWARGLIDWAEALMASGEAASLQRAEDLLRQSQSAFEEMGAPGYAAVVQDRLEALAAIRKG